MTRSPSTTGDAAAASGEDIAAGDWLAEALASTCRLRKSFIELESNDRLPCDHCGVSINVADDYKPASLDAIAKQLGSVGHIPCERKKRD